MSNRLSVASGTDTNHSSAEIASVILCTCFPTMPRLARLVAERYPSYVSRLIKREKRHDSVSRKPMVGGGGERKEQPSSSHTDTTGGMEKAPWEH